VADVYYNIYVYIYILYCAIEYLGCRLQGAHRRKLLLYLYSAVHHTSDIDQAPIHPTRELFYTYFFNHARRHRLENLLYCTYIQSFLEVPAGFLNHFWIQVPLRIIAVSEVGRLL
jgi:hypothetical protein